MRHACLVAALLVTILPLQSFGKEPGEAVSGDGRVGSEFDTALSGGHLQRPSLPVNEACTKADGGRATLGPRSVIKYSVYCGTEVAGFVMQADGISPNVLSNVEQTAVITDLYQYLRENESVECGSPQIADFGGVSLWALACRDLIDGWPSIALVHGTSNGSQIAFGAVSALPFLASNLNAGISLPTEKMFETVAKLWPSHIPLASLADRHRVGDLWASAREASAKLDFETAQAQLDIALELQVRLFGETDLRTAALLLDLAMVLAYQEDFDAVDAIIRRAGPIIDQSPRASERARLAGYQSSIAALQGDFQSASQYASSATAQWREIAGSNDQEALLSLFQSKDERPIDAEPELALALAREGAILLRLDDPVSAYAKAGEALLIFNGASQKPPIWRSEILAVLAEASSALGRLSAAEQFFENAITIRRTREGDGTGVIRLLLAQGRAYQREAMNVNAIITFRRAIGIA